MDEGTRRPHLLELQVSRCMCTFKDSSSHALQDFKNRGTWDSMYIDNDLRVFRTNKKNLFVLKRMT